MRQIQRIRRICNMGNSSLPSAACTPNHARCTAAGSGFRLYRKTAQPDSWQRPLPHALSYNRFFRPDSPFFCTLKKGLSPLCFLAHSTGAAFAYADSGKCDGNTDCNYANRYD